VWPYGRAVTPIHPVIDEHSSLLWGRTWRLVDARTGELIAGPFDSLEEAQQVLAAQVAALRQPQGLLDWLL